MLQTVAVTCTAYDQNGDPVAGGRVVAVLDQTEIDGGFVVPEKVEGVTDAQGVCVLQLWPNALGVAGSGYLIRAWNPDTGKRYLDARAVVPNSACRLEDILVQEPYPAIDAAQQALIAAQGALAPVTAQAAISTAKAAEATASATASEASRVASGASATAASGSATTATAQAALATERATAAAGSATTATGAASSAQASAVAAAGSQGAAATSATTAASQAAAAVTSASESEASRVASGVSATAAATSAASAQGSANTAATQAASAATSATNAAGSAATAVTQASAAGSSASSAESSASAAHASASSASSSASAASTSAGTATTKAAEAVSARDAASTKATEAATSAASAAADRVQTGIDRTATAADRVQTGQDATTATTQAGVATTKASEAANSATAAAASATAAASSASGAASSASTASAQAATATTQATSATASALSAANSFDAFDDRFLGAKAANPTLDNDGQTLLVGALYWNTAESAMRVWSGTAWIDTNELDGRILADQQLLGAVAYATDMALKGLDGITENRGTFGSTDRAELFAYMFGELLDKIGVIGRAISGGTIELQAGTAAIPSLTSATDVATGVFFPANGAMAVATAGLERLRITADGRIGLGTNAPSGLLDLADNKLRVRTAQTPASATAAGNQGEIAWDASFVYVCINTNTWRRVALSAW